MIDSKTQQRAAQRVLDDAYQKHMVDKANAWKADQEEPKKPEVGAGFNGMQQEDEARKDDPKAAYDRMMDRLANAWKESK